MYPSRSGIAAPLGDFASSATYPRFRPRPVLRLGQTCLKNMEASVTPHVMCSIAHIEPPGSGLLAAWTHLLIFCKVIRNSSIGREQWNWSVTDLQGYSPR